MARDAEGTGTGPLTGPQVRGSHAGVTYGVVAMLSQPNRAPVEATEAHLYRGGRHEAESAPGPGLPLLRLPRQQWPATRRPLPEAAQRPARHLGFRRRPAQPGQTQ